MNIKINIDSSHPQKQPKPKKSQCKCKFSELDKHGQCKKMHDIIDQCAHLDTDLPICEDFESITYGV